MQSLFNHLKDKLSHYEAYYGEKEKIASRKEEVAPILTQLPKELWRAQRDTYPSWGGIVVDTYTSHLQVDALNYDKEYLTLYLDKEGHLDNIKKLTTEALVGGVSFTVRLGEKTFILKGSQASTMRTQSGTIVAALIVLPPMTMKGVTPTYALYTAPGYSHLLYPDLDKQTARDKVHKHLTRYLKENPHLINTQGARNANNDNTRANNANTVYTKNKANNARNAKAHANNANTARNSNNMLTHVGNVGNVGNVFNVGNAKASANTARNVGNGSAYNVDNASVGNVGNVAFEMDWALDGGTLVMVDQGGGCMGVMVAQVGSVALPTPPTPRSQANPRNQAKQNSTNANNANNAHTHNTQNTANNIATRPSAPFNANNAYKYPINENKRLRGPYNEYSVLNMFANVNNYRYGGLNSRYLVNYVNFLPYFLDVDGPYFYANPFGNYTESALSPLDSPLEGVGTFQGVLPTFVPNTGLEREEMAYLASVFSGNGFAYNANNARDVGNEREFFEAIFDDFVEGNISRVTDEDGNPVSCVEEIFEVEPFVTEASRISDSLGDSVLNHSFCESVRTGGLLKQMLATGATLASLNQNLLIAQGVDAMIPDNQTGEKSDAFEEENSKKLSLPTIVSPSATGEISVHQLTAPELDGLEVAYNSEVESAAASVHLSPTTLGLHKQQISEDYIKTTQQSFSRKVQTMRANVSKSIKRYLKLISRTHPELSWIDDYVDDREILFIDAIDTSEVVGYADAIVKLAEAGVPIDATMVTRKLGGREYDSLLQRVHNVDMGVDNARNVGTVGTVEESNEENKEVD